MIHACRHEPSFVHVQVGHGGHEGGKMGVDGRGGRSGNGGRVGLGRLFLPCLIFLLFPFVRSVLLVPLLLWGLLGIVLLLSLASNGAELGIELQLTLQGGNLGGHCHNLLVVGGFGFPLPFRLEEVELAFGHGHHGLVSETGEIPVKVLIVLGVDVLCEVVAWYQEIGFEEDADGVVEGGPSRK